MHGSCTIGVLYIGKINWSMFDSSSTLYQVRVSQSPYPDELDRRSGLLQCLAPRIRKLRMAGWDSRHMQALLADLASSGPREWDCLIKIIGRARAGVDQHVSRVTSCKDLSAETLDEHLCTSTNGRNTSELRMSRIMKDQNLIWGQCADCTWQNLLGYYL